MRVAGSTTDKLLANESFYYRGESCFTMPLERMDSCAGLIISARELVRFAASLPDESVEQRGSLDGCECMLIKREGVTSAIFCNKRKSYAVKLPLRELLD